MKQLKHNFIRSGEYNFVTTYDKCKYCGKSGFQLFHIIQKYNKNIDLILNKYEYSKNRSFENDLDFYNKYCPCLTEEEYIIKNIIE